MRMQGTRLPALFLSDSAEAAPAFTPSSWMHVATCRPASGRSCAAHDTSAVRARQESCCGGQHTYAHAQQMLTALGRHPRGARFRRLAQELEAHAAAAAGPVVWQMARWCDSLDHVLGTLGP